MLIFFNSGVAPELSEINTLPARNGGLGGIGRPEPAGMKEPTCVMRVFCRFSFVLAASVMPK